jgi:exodeoxyribonuclease V
MLTTKEIVSLLEESFSYTPTSDQHILLRKLAAFLFSHEPNKTFLLKGFAGTGKTTVVSVLVNILPQLKLDSMLLAPTGRAAKVLSSYSGQHALTIHKAIYRTSDGESGFYLSLRENVHKNTVFIVDEASMIAADTPERHGLFPVSNILEDLLTYIFSGENCSLIFVGDTAQLPPVGTTLSLALNAEYLKTSYHLTLDSFELTEVVRQAEDSGILSNATHIRKLVKEEQTDHDFFTTRGYKDVMRINGDELEDMLNTAYSQSGDTETIVICRSNKRANLFNNEIRHRILYREGEINAADKIMIVKNNYFWISKRSKAGFIANGDIAEVLRIKNNEVVAGTYNFVDAAIRLIDYPEEKDFEVKLLMNTLQMDAPSLSYNDYKILYNEVAADYQHITDKYQRLKLMQSNPYLNALQIKFAYAMTCHKTQGGQWENVFVEQGYLTDEMVNMEYLRWLYTAVTRGTKKLYLVNFNERFFKT